MWSLLALSFPIGIFAAPFSQQESPDRVFSRVDSDADGNLSFGEFLRTESEYERLKRNFDGSDLNKDGRISRAEFDRNWILQSPRTDDERAAYYGSIFQDFDADFDIEMSRDEVQKMMATRYHVKVPADFALLFASFDANNDGALDLFEFMRFDAQFPYASTVPMSDEEVAVMDDVEAIAAELEQEEDDGNTEVEMKTATEVVDLPVISEVKGKKQEKLPMQKAFARAAPSVAAAPIDSAPFEDTPRPSPIPTDSLNPSIRPVVPGPTKPMIVIY